MGKTMRYLLVVFLLLLGACDKAASIKPLHAIDVSWQRPHADFHLTDAGGAPRALADFRDKVVIVFFGYTHCPEVCPTTLADLAQAMRALGADARRVQVIFITVDPERDTPALLGKFVPAFDASFIALSGDRAAITRAANSFGVNFEKHAEAGGGYSVDHTDGTFLIGMGGAPLWMSPYAQRTSYLVDDIRQLLNHTGG
jgi:protein SCO1/2